jgi:hypothetical protein
MKRKPRTPAGNRAERPKAPDSPGGGRDTSVEAGPMDLQAAVTSAMQAVRRRSRKALVPMGRLVDLKGFAGRCIANSRNGAGPLAGVQQSRRSDDAFHSAETSSPLHGALDYDCWGFGAV